MKKAKKLGLQSLALVLMAFVLVAGVAFGMTGAWFTSNDNGTSAVVTMGNKVDISLKQDGNALSEHVFNLIPQERTYKDGEEDATSGLQALDHIMPGDSLKVEGGLAIHTAAANSAMYVYVKIEFLNGDGTAYTGTAFNKNSVTYPTTGLPTGTTKLAANELPATGLTYEVYKVAEVDEATNVLTIIDGNTAVTVSDTLENEVAGENFKIRVSVVAVQAANWNVAAKVDTDLALLA